jgi:hypothetical protein
MLYVSHDNKLPIHVQVELIDGHNATVLQRAAELTYPSQELTVARFRLDDHGAVVADSVNDLYRPLYAASGGTQ